MPRKTRTNFFNFTRQELALFARLDTPQKIQKYLNTLPINFEENGETYMSPRRVLREKTAHCSEGALLAAIILWYHGQKPLLLDLRSAKHDTDHVVALFKQNGKWGAISKTNHAALRFREPVYNTVRELALSYFHEYFDDKGRKNLRVYSEPFDLSKYKDKSWMTTDKNLFELMYYLDRSKGHALLNKKQINNLSKADQLEIKAGKLQEWRRPRTKKGKK